MAAHFFGFSTPFNSLTQDTVHILMHLKEAVDQKFHESLISCWILLILHSILVQALRRKLDLVRGWKGEILATIDLLCSITDSRPVYADVKRVAIGSTRGVQLVFQGSVSRL